MDFDVKQVVTKILEDLDYADRRAAKLDNDDFLIMLDRFNKEGFRFTAGSASRSF